MVSVSDTLRRRSRPRKARNTVKRTTARRSRQTPRRKRKMPSTSPWRMVSMGMVITEIHPLSIS